MELQQFLEQRFGVLKSTFTSELLAKSKAFYEATEWVEDENRAAATLASFVCQAAVVALRGMVAFPTRLYPVETVFSSEPLLMNVAGRFGLLLLDDVLRYPWVIRGEPWSTGFPFRPRSFEPELIPRMWYAAVIVGMEHDAKGIQEPRVRQQVGRTARLARGFVEDTVFQECLRELMVVAMPRPSTILTAVPRPTWSVSPTNPSSMGVTAGLLVKDSSGRRGVTTALHGLGDPLPPLGAAVYIDGNLGTLEAIDPISDSCFISIPDSLQPLATYGGGGVLSCQTPGQGERAVFERIGSGRKTTTVLLVDPWVTIATNLSQKKLYTAADTQLGDSGSALVDMQDRVIGFSLERTGIGAPIEFSAWIWADLAVRRLNITPFP